MHCQSSLTEVRDLTTNELKGKKSVGPLGLSVVNTEMFDDIYHGTFQNEQSAHSIFCL